MNDEFGQSMEDLIINSLLVESSQIGIIAFDRKCRYTVWNPAMEALTGVRRSESLGRYAADVDPLQLFRNGWGGSALGDMLEGGAPVTQTRSRAMPESGREGLFRVLGHPLRNSSGAVVGGLAFVLDVTDTKLVSEGNLRHSEQDLEATFEQAAVGMAHVAPDGKWVRVNSKLCRIVGYERHELLQLTFQDITHPEDLEPDLAYVRRMLDGEIETYSMEKRYFRKDGSVVWINLTVSLVRSDEGTPQYFISVIEDIDQRKQAEFSLQRSEGRYRDLVANVNAGIVVHGPDSAVRMANPRALELLDLTGEQAAGKTATDPQWLFLDDNGDPMPLDEYPVMSVIRSGAPLHDQVVGVRRPRRDDVVWVLCNGFPAYDALGVLDHVVITFVDISALRRAEEERLALEEQLRHAQKMEAVGRLAGGVAHDFNNILTCIRGFSELLLEKLEADDPNRAELGEILKASDSAAALTGQLLAFSRKQIIKPEVLDLNLVLQGAEAILRRVIGEDIELRFIRGEGLWPVLADRGQVDQVLVNLAVNARDAMPDGGRLTIETANVSMEERSCQQCSRPFTGEYVLLAVSDTGEGIDREAVARIFEPFFTTKDSGRGTGLGLSTVEGIVHQSSGHINFYSEPGVGTAFKIYLPRTAVTGRPGVHAAGLAVADVGGTETILLVEDQEQVRSLARRALAREGYTVLEARDSKEALALAGSHGGRIDLLLTDVVLPKMNGPDLYQCLLETLPGLVAVFMSGYTENAIAHHGVLEEGINFIQKPFRPRDLCLKVREALDRK